jgi:hypothetical protein
MDENLLLIAHMQQFLTENHGLYEQNQRGMPLPNRVNHIFLDKNEVIQRNQVEDLLKKNDSLQGMICQSKSRVLDQLRKGECRERSIGWCFG